MKKYQKCDETYCGAYCLNMIYLIDNGYRIKSTLITLVNQVKTTEAYNECLGIKVKGELRVEIGVNVNVNNNVNNNVNDNVKDGKAWSKTHNVNDNFSFQLSYCNRINPSKIFLVNTFLEHC